MIRPLIAIDGPSGSGKSTIARAVANALGVGVLDTGAMYRAVTLAVLENDVGLDDENACVRVATSHEIVVNDNTTTLDGRDVSHEIRGPMVTQAVSTIAAHPAVRRVLVDKQRAWVAANGGGVVEGRDIGTIVFPEAPVKVFLVASDEVRAQRRQRDEAAADREVDVDQVKVALERRDALDAGRAVSPLRPAPDAIVIDTSDLDADTVAEKIVRAFREAETD